MRPRNRYHQEPAFPAHEKSRLQFLRHPLPKSPSPRKQAISTLHSARRIPSRYAVPNANLRPPVGKPPHSRKIAFSPSASPTPKSKKTTHLHASLRGGFRTRTPSRTPNPPPARWQTSPLTKNRIFTFCVIPSPRKQAILAPHSAQRGQPGIVQALD